MSSYQYFLNAACLRQSSSSCIDTELNRKEFLTSSGVPTGNGSLYGRCAPSSVDYYSNGGASRSQLSYIQQQQLVNSGNISPQSPSGYPLNISDLKSMPSRDSSHQGVSLGDLAFQERAAASSGFNELLQHQQQQASSNRTGNGGNDLQYGSSTPPTSTTVSNSGRVYNNNNNGLESSSAAAAVTVNYSSLHSAAPTRRCSSPSLSPTPIKPSPIISIAAADDNSSGALSPPLSNASSPDSVASSIDDYQNGHNTHHHHLQQHRGGLQLAGGSGIAGGPPVDDLKASSVGSACSNSSSASESSNGGLVSSGGSTTATSGARTPSINEPTIYPWMRRVHSGHGGMLSTFIFTI